MTADELRRYSRQTILGEVGVGGQELLKSARVLVVGAGGLGTPLSLYLAAAGIGTIGLVDDDKVSLDNLHRQILYGDADVGKSKVVTAKDRLGRLKSVDVVAHEERFTEDNARKLLKDYDVVCDGTDNFAVRYLINDYSIEMRKPNVHASVFQFQGQLSVFGYKDGPCYRCLFPNRPAHAPSCEEAGVLGVVPGVMGLLQATEVLKVVLGVGEPLSGRLLMYDALTAKTSEVRFNRDRLCPCCGTNRDEAHLKQAYSETESCVMHLQVPEISPLELKAELESSSPPVIVDVREDHEREISTLPNAIAIPLGQLPTRYGELDQAANMVILCRSGSRSAQATAFLMGLGYKRVRNLATGINGWATTVDPTMPTY